MTMKLIPLTRGLFTKVDDEDFEKFAVYRWQANTKMKGGVRVVRNVKKGNSSTSFYLHREIMNAKKGQYVDHINGDALDNRKSNLRFCTVSQNAFNTPGKNIRKSRFKGVYKVGAKWQAQIKANGKAVRTRVCETEEEAAKAWDELAKKLHGEFARLNLPDK